MSRPLRPEFQRASELLKSVRGVPLSRAELAAKAVDLAGWLLVLAEQEKSAAYRERAEVLSRMMLDRPGQAFTTALTDRAHRSNSPRTTLAQATHLLDTLGAPDYLSYFEQLQLTVLKLAGGLAPGLARNKMLEKIREETAAYILPAEPARLSEYLQRRRAEGTRVNVNHLGEEVLGESEAERRVLGYIELLEQPEVETISVKISSIYSQLDALAFDATLSGLRERLRPIYRAALASQCAGRLKLVTLDMEAYRDVALTLAAFQSLLDEPEFQRLRAGCVLQAYLPDSFAQQAALLDWAKKRCAAGGSPIRIRVVKGANLAMERMESVQRGWTLPVYATKREVDANYKRMILQGAQAENAKVAQLGIASHNLFDVCFGLLVRASCSSEAWVSFELLEGMADPLRAVLRQLGAEVLLYAPIVEAEEFPSGIAYLVRRLDENTAKENFLRHSFQMQLGDASWDVQRQAFSDACGRIDRVAELPRRQATLNTPRRTVLSSAFSNEPDTDFGLAENRERLNQALKQLRERDSELLHSEVAGAEGPFLLESGVDPSRPRHVPYRVELLDAAAAEVALGNSEAAGGAWWQLDFEQRAELLLACAAALRGARAELIALLVSDGAKRADEADVEVSEAIDFAEYYARSALDWAKQADPQSGTVTFSPLGPVLVTPPWNFPLAIPLGGVFAALVMGNPVILKPAPETPRVARRAAELCWQAGIPKAVLQLFISKDEVASKLLCDPRVKACVLTGASSTAQLFQRLRPDLKLFAETGGKNTLIVTEMADRELAIQDAVASAFGHAGQKCSALSVLILHKELYDDAHFLATLRDAAASLPVGGAWDLSSKVTPLIQEPNELQRRALSTLAPGESWLLQPLFSDANPRLVSPGIKLGVQAGSASHQTEFFCPLLAVLRAEDLDHALQIANATPYGLTAGIHTLDEREQAYWAERMQAGNLYVNRRITGAIVQRQPFGGWKASSFGSGAKAGGPNYLQQFVTPSPRHAASIATEPLPAALEQKLRELRRTLEKVASDNEVNTGFDQAYALAQNYSETQRSLFAEPSDPAALPGQDNLLRYVPARLALCVPKNAEAPPLKSLLAAAVASWVTASELSLWVHSHWQSHPLINALSQHFNTTFFERAQDLAARLQQGAIERVQVLGAVAPELRALVHATGAYLTDQPALGVGRFDLLLHLKEQALSVTYHRYGHLGLRGVKTPPERALKSHRAA